MTRGDVLTQVAKIRLYKEQGFICSDTMKKRILQVVENYRSYVIGNRIRGEVDGKENVSVCKASSESGTSHSRWQSVRRSE